MINLSPHKIVISPIGRLDAKLFEPIIEGVKRIFGIQARIKPLIPDVSFAHDPDRDQHHSTTILEKIANLAPSDALKVLAVTDVDLFIPILTHVYGEAQLGGKACIVSLHRLDEGLFPAAPRKDYTNRIVKEAIHELGHTFNLLHCKDNSCIMHYCRSIKDVDQKSDQLCRYCKILLDDEMQRLEKTVCKCE